MAEPTLDDSDRADLAALADGTLPPSRRAEVEARVAASPALRAELEAQRAALAAMDAAADEDGASERLRRWLADQPAAPAPAAAPAGAAAPRRRRLSGGALRAGLVAAVAAAAVLFVFTTNGTSLQEVANAVARPPDTAAPQKADGGTLAIDSDGLAFPDWEPRGWRAVGVRTDQLDGREATTVTYENDAKDRFHYAIVPRPVVDDTPPEGYGLTELDGKPAVVWERDGRTCLLISNAVHIDDLVDLARTTSAPSY